MSEYFSKLSSLYSNVLTLREKQERALSDKITVNAADLSGKLDKKIQISIITGFFKNEKKINKYPMTITSFIPQHCFQAKMICKIIARKLADYSEKINPLTSNIIRLL